MQAMHFIRAIATLFIVAACMACAQDSPSAIEARTANVSSTTTAQGCLPLLDGSFTAQLRGEIVADIHWTNLQMQCEGGVRPQDSGIRASIAGPLTTAGPRPAQRLRFVFGIATQDIAAGSAREFPTNITLILEGEQQLYSTQGNKCAAEQLERSPLPASQPRKERVHVRGYCVLPAADISGTRRVLVPTFEFTSVIDAQESP
jgi:hypothetical protein